MDKVLSFIRDRLAEPTSRLHYAMVLGQVLALLGLLATDQIGGFTATVAGVLGFVASLAAVMQPEAPSVPASPEEAANALLAAADDAVRARIPGAREAAGEIARAIENATPVIGAVSEMMKR